MIAQDLLYIVLLALITSLVIWGAHSVTRPGKLFECIDTAWYRFTGSLAGMPVLMRFFYQLANPLFRCPVCMSSLWSIGMWALITGSLTWHVLILMLMVCGLNTLIILFTDYTVTHESDTTD